MTDHPPRRATRAALSSIAAAVLLACTLAAQAQPAAKEIDLPAQPLDKALRELASQTGARILFSTDLTEQKQAPALKGRLTPQEALERLLSGSGLVVRPTPDGGFTVAPRPVDSSEATLPAVKVMARQDGATEGSGSFTTGSSSSATGLNLSLRETPQSVTVITRERMDLQKLASLADVAEQVTGVYFVGHGTPVGGRSELISRGFTINSFQVDGVNVPWELLGESYRYSHASLDSAIYDSMTFVRGATGLLTGAGDPSGSIALTRKRPTKEFQASVEGSLGRWDRRRVVADVGGSLNQTGSLRGRLVGAYDEGKTWVERYSDDRSTVYGIVEADVTPDTLLTVTLERARSRSKGTYWHEAFGPPLFFSDGVTPIPAGLSTNMAPDWTYTDSTRTGLSASLAHHFNTDWSTTFTYGQSQYDIDSRRGMVYEVPAGGVPTETRLLVVDQRNKVQFADLKVEGKYTLFGRKHDVVGGINASRVRQRFPLSHISDDGTYGFARWVDGRMVYDTPDWSAVADPAYNYPSITSTDQYGGYLATRLRPIQPLSVILGGRLTTWKTLSADTTPYFVWDDRRYDREFTPYVGVVADLSQSLSAYASYTEIFNPAYDKDVNGQLLDPESGKNLEVGLKGEWFDKRLNASISVFETRKDNLAVEDGINTTPDGDQAYRAESNTKGRGWELEVAGEPIRGLQIQGGYSQFRIHDNEGALLNTYIPIRQLKLYTSYRPAALRQLIVGAGVRWQSSTYADWVTPAERPAYTLKSYAIVDLNASYELTNALGLSVSLHNALDKRYRTDTSTQSYGAPRILYATLKYKF
ncbi:MAG: TonB-dependent siderophore receptor [Rhizobacter sp.]